MVAAQSDGQKPDGLDDTVQRFPRGCQDSEEGVSRGSTSHGADSVYPRKAAAVEGRRRKGVKRWRNQEHPSLAPGTSSRCRAGKTKPSTKKSRHSSSSMKKA